MRCCCRARSPPHRSPGSPSPPRGCHPLCGRSAPRPAGRTAPAGAEPRAPIDLAACDGPRFPCIRLRHGTPDHVWTRCCCRSGLRTLCSTSTSRDLPCVRKVLVADTRVPTADCVGDTNGFLIEIRPPVRAQLQPGSRSSSTTAFPRLQRPGRRAQAAARLARDLGPLSQRPNAAAMQTPAY